MGALRSASVAVGLVALALVVAAAVAAPAYRPAHNCNSGESGGCGPCVEGEQHAHNDPGGQCATTPGFEAAALLVAGVGAALVVQRRRED